VTVFSLDRDACRAALERLARALCATRSEVEDVILFGSLVGGRAGPRSDADILIILRDSPLRFLDRITSYARAFATSPIPCDVLPYTRAEVESLAAGPGVVRAALRSGQSLLGRGGPAA
jgi:predicted nucleotidyltransferase